MSSVHDCDPNAFERFLIAIRTVDYMEVSAVRRPRDAGISQSRALRDRSLVHKKNKVAPEIGHEWGRNVQ